ncbi:fumarate hydratase [Jiulongibacter sp. NS-SX5]|uniref:fumarate hydratase n=1 Tax=Jiulongibacter sp. NS-SX5 TaxID=3463854 RepID=UPI004058206D
MKAAVISGDIVAYSSLNKEGRVLLEQEVESIFETLRTEFKCYCRLLKGDYIECATEVPAQGLRIALILKTGLKAHELDLKKHSQDYSRTKYLKDIGLRLALSHAELDEFNRETGRIDGTAIFMAGREISGQKTFNKSRIVIKNSLFFVSDSQDLQRHVEPVMELLDVLLNKATGKQCQVVYFKLLGFTEKEIAEKLNVAQSVINQHSTSSGWNAIEKAVLYFEELIS